LALPEKLLAKPNRREGIGEKKLVMSRCKEVL